MTSAAKAFGKDVYEFLRLPSTKAYMEALSGIFPVKELTAVQRGDGRLPTVGTWGHPKLAVFFARWLDVRFSVWCDSVIDELLRGKATVVPTRTVPAPAPAV